MIVLDFKKWLNEDSDITGIEAPVQRPDKLNTGAYPTYEITVAKFQKKKMSKNNKRD